ncbi:MAG TPA: GatB/YqeY domain-containing protein [Xylella sp.]
MSIKQKIADDMKIAMKNGDKHSLGVIRLINAAIKQKEIDERITLDDETVLSVMQKMVKQRKDSLQQYSDAGREDLAHIEREEIVVIERYLPAKLGEAEVVAAIQAAIVEIGASIPSDMGKLMGALKSKLAGQADMGQVSALVKKYLSH